MNNADIAWMLVSTALVLLMTPALAFFYGGLVRSKNALNTMMMSFVALGPVAVAWALVGYSLAFAPGSAVVGSLGYAGLRGVGMQAQGTIPHLLFMAFQGTFAIITPALISGAVVERMRFNDYIAFITLWVVFVYAPIAHWVWGGGSGCRRANRLWPPRHPAARRAVHDARCRTAVFRLVRLQCRQRTLAGND